MLKIIETYLVYDLIIGFLAACYYGYKERKIVNLSEFIWVILFPAIGFGRWQYQRQLREEGEATHSEKWYIYHQMARIHAGYIICLFIAGVIMMGIIGLFADGGNDWAMHQNNAIAQGFGWITSVGMFVLLVAGIIIYMLALLVLSFFMVFLPWKKAKSLEIESEDIQE